jgi:6-phosphogluconolactonase
MSLSSSHRSSGAGVRSPSRQHWMYVGTYTRGKSEGIYLCSMDAGSGAIVVKEAMKGIENPSFLAADPRQRFLYAVSETAEFNGLPGGSVQAFRIDPDSGRLSLVNARSSEGAGPCHLTIDKRGRWVLVANYSTGNLAVLPVRDDGSLGKATDVVFHRGASVNSARQQGPHAHSVTLDVANRYAIAADLGIDKLMVYHFDGDRGTLKPAAIPWIAVKPGAGPRHFTFHPDGTKAYVINELDSTVTAFSYERDHGVLKETQTVATIPGDVTGPNYCADIHVSADGRFVYGSNRGHDSIVVFAVEENTGLLTLLQHQPTGGKTPRNFAIDPAGRFLLVANQNSDSIVVFTIDQEDGLLAPTGIAAEVPTPVCIRFGAGQP